MATVNTGLEDDDAQTICDRLETLLADEFVLATMARNFHWNIVSPSFAELHRFLEEQYDAFDAAIDEVAERIRALGGNPVATVRSFLDLTRIEEPEAAGHQDAMMEALLEGCESLCRSIREDVETCRDANDAGTEAFLTELLVRHEKQAWMVRSFLAGRSDPAAVTGKRGPRGAARKGRPRHAAGHT